MKKSFLAFAAVAAILAGCAKDIDNQNPTPEETLVVLRASVPDSGTRVSTDNAGAFRWQAGDIVSVLNTSGSVFEFSTATGGTSVDLSSATFTGTLSTKAYYPASANHTLDNFYLEPVINWNEDASMMPMLGTVNTSELTASFRSAGAVLKLVCFNVDAAARKLVVTSATKKLNGEFEPTGDPKTITTADKGADDNSVTITFADGHPTNMVFYIPLPTGNLGKLTFVMKNSSDVNVSDPKETKGNVEISRNQIVVAPALNCAPAVVLWSEDFTGYVADKDWKGANSAAIITSGDHAGHASGDSEITYTTTDGNSATKIYTTDIGAGGESPELLIGKKQTSPAVAGGTFVVANIPTNGASKMILSFGTSNSIKLSATSGITLSETTLTGAGSKSVTLTNTGSLDSFDLTFNCDYTKNCRIDDIVLTIAPATFTAPALTPDEDALEIAVGSTVATTDFTYTNKVDDMPVVAVVSDDAKAWLSAEITGTYPDYTLTVSAAGAHNGAADRTGTVSLKASGASKSIAVTQKTKLVPNPTVTVTPGDEQFSASWTADANASSYVAYLHTAATATPATGGTDITSSISHVGSAYSITDYATDNGSYYLYIKVNEVTSGYEAPTAYVEKTFTCEGTPKGSAVENPYTVTEAKSAYDDAGADVSNVYVMGIVSTAGFTTGSGASIKVNCWISVDGTTTSEFELYNITSGEGKSDFEVGDAVIAHGTLTKFSTTYELSGTTIDAIIKKPTFTPDGANFVTSQSVAIASTGSSSIRYTIDGSAPSVSAGSEYSSALDLSATTTVKAVGIDANGIICTGVASATFTKLETYAVTWSAPANGSITVKNGESTISSGAMVPETATVNITATPNDGYILSSLSYNDGSAHDIKAAKSFTMPSHAVSITATFEAVAGPVDLEAPESIAITDINIAEKKFSGSWAANADASSYDWVVSTASTAAEIAAGNTKASGNTTSTSFTTTALDGDFKPVAGTVYYLYVRSVGDGVSFVTSSYGQAHAILYQHVFSTKPSSTPVTLSTISWGVASSNLNNFNNGYAGVQVGTGSKTGSLTLTSTNAWGAQTSTAYNSYTTVKKVNVWMNAGTSGSIAATVTIGGKSATSSGTTVASNSAANSYVNATKVSYTPASDGKTGVIVITASKANASQKAGYVCAIEVLSE